MGCPRFPDLVLYGRGLYRRRFCTAQSPSNSYEVDRIRAIPPAKCPIGENWPSPVSSVWACVIWKYVFFAALPRYTGSGRRRITRRCMPLPAPSRLLGAGGVERRGVKRNKSQDTGSLIPQAYVEPQSSRPRWGPSISLCFRATGGKLSAHIRDN